MQLNTYQQNIQGLYNLNQIKMQNCIHVGYKVYKKTVNKWHARSAYTINADQFYIVSAKIIDMTHSVYNRESN